MKLQGNEGIKSAMRGAGEYGTTENEMSYEFRAFHAHMLVSY